MILALGAALTVAPALANPLSFGAKPSTSAAANSAATATTPEIEQADQKVGELKRKVEQAKQQLEAAKAHLRAAEAEYKAAQADKQALVLRNHARELASAAAIGPVDSVSPAAGNPANNAPSDIQAQPVQPAAPAPGATLQDLVP